MTNEEIQGIIQGTLDWCNEQREKKGLKPLASLPRGKRAAPLSCPCGKATGRWVTAEHHYSSRNGELVFETQEPLPKPVIEFVCLFDNGLLAQFDITVNS